MKKSHKLVLVSLLLVMAGCTAETVETTAPNEPAKQYGIEDVDASHVNPHAKAYYDLLKTAILATNSNLPQTKSGDTDSLSDNPLADKLESMNIVNESGNSISFSSMEKEKQIEFLDDWALLEASEMSEKMSLQPELETYIQEENEIVTQAISEEGVQTRNGDIKIANKNNFFKKVRERMQNLYTAQEQEQTTTPATRIDISPVVNEYIPIKNLKLCLQEYARRGDFIVKLPKTDEPWIYLNLSENTNGELQYGVGHVAIINAKVDTTWSYKRTFTWGAQSSGITNETLKSWCVRSFIMGIQKVTWKLEWKNFKMHLYKTVTPVSNTEALADKAAEYAGHEYVKWYEFFTAKWLAPTRFTCTTLVWYCTKETYGIDLSPWWATMVTPSELYLNSNTYLRKEIK